MRSPRFDQVLAGYDALALDLPGFGGASPEPPTATGAAGYAELVAPPWASVPAGSWCSATPSAAGWPCNLAATHPDRIAAWC